jgi:LuxR family transcriptional regulator, maltose regulon positive regulatory protein
MRETALPLAETKLMLPRLRAEMVARPRVLQALGRDDVRLTLVAAPPGYGKTVAARTWYEGCPGSVAWVTLDAGDNDPVRFWTYAATAVDRIRGGLGRAALQRLRLVGGTLEGALIELLNGIAALGGPLTIVLDDFQSITDLECLESIDYAIEHLPPTTRLVLLTRSDPSLRLPQLRANRSLVEIRANDLAFTTAEAHELLVERGRLPLDEEEVRVLHERTEGWPGALYLALLWLRGLDDPHGAVREFGGDHRFVADYLNHEILSSLDAKARWFLLHTSVLGHFTAELCDEVFARFDSASALDRLEHSNLFVAGLEHGGWYRVHPLFAEFAEFQLAKVDPGAAQQIHRRAARWFLARGLPLEAVEHAAAAGDHELVAEISLDQHMTLVRNGGARTFLRWTSMLPEAKLLEHPELAMGAASAVSFVGPRTIERRRFLSLAERARAEHPARFTRYVEAGIGMTRAFTIDEGVSAAVADGRRAVELAETDADDLLVSALASLAQALYFDGDCPGASAAALRAIEHPHAEHRPTAHALARSTLALADLDRGLVDAARVHAEKARSLVGSIHSSRSWLGANAYAAVAAVHASEEKLVEAERELVYAERFFHDEVPTVHHTWLLFLLARIRCRRGRLSEAQEALHSARLELDGLEDAGRLPMLADEVEREVEAAGSRADQGEILERPSEAELAVLRLLASELSAREIGNRLFLSANTVRTHTRAIYRKLGVNSRADAVARATVLDLLEGPRSVMADEQLQRDQQHA